MYISSVPSTGSGMLGGPSSSGGLMPLPPSQAAPAIGKLCSKCQVRQTNPGKGWCQQCFTQS